MQSLNVKYNNDKSRDYTNPTLPTGDPNLDAASLALGDQLLPQLLLGAAGTQPRARLPGGYFSFSYIFLFFIFFIFFLFYRLVAIFVLFLSFTAFLLPLQLLFIAINQARVSY